MTKGRAAQLFKKILENYSKLSAMEYQDILRASVTDWVAKVTAPEPAGPEVPVMCLKEVAAADKARPSSAAAASAAAAAAAAAAGGAQHPAHGQLPPGALRALQLAQRWEATEGARVRLLLADVAILLGLLFCVVSSAVSRAMGWPSNGLNLFVSFIGSK
jgi:hypothetical protein